MLQMLTEKEILRIGMRVECSQCQQFNWYSLDELSFELRCQRCLREFPFPSATPPDEWHYRTVGPFATENFAQGGYTVALALHALSSRIGAEATWIPSFDLESPDGKKLEADFAMLWQDNFPLPGPSRLIMGECKSLNRFETRDIERMQDMATAFPSCVLAFCTLREHLDVKERKQLTRLVKSARSVKQEVIILTGLELLGVGIPDCWGEDGRTFAMRARGYRKIDELAALTQRLHLGM
jgi:hypothetical protein